MFFLGSDHDAMLSLLKDPNLLIFLDTDVGPTILHDGPLSGLLFLGFGART